MSVRFPVNERYVESAREVLSRHDGIRWILGGACSGKSSIAGHLSARRGIPLYDMDAKIFDGYLTRYRPDRHPATAEWFGQPDGLAWALSLSWEEFDALNWATNAEYLDLLAEDVAAAEPASPLLIDGGMSHPALVARVIANERIVCLKRPREASVRAWEGDPGRTDMKEAILALPGGSEMWAKFLRFDQLLTETLLSECEECCIPIVDVDDRRSLEENAAAAAASLWG